MLSKYVKVHPSSSDKGDILNSSFKVNSSINSKNVSPTPQLQNTLGMNKYCSLDEMKRALDECCRRSDDFFGGKTTTTSSTSHPDLSPMDKLAHKCVSLQFLLEFNEQVVQPYRPTMTVKQVVEEIIIPATREKGCSFIDQLRPSMYVIPHAFVSHAFGNPIAIIVESLKSYFKDAIYSEIYVWIDIFIINQHNPGADLHGGLTLKATIEASVSVLVCLDKNTLPLFRLWCLYEIGSTPIEKLVLLTHGFDASELGLAYAKIDATTADCWAQSDKEMIRGHIRDMMVQQEIVSSEATILEALAAFTSVLKLLLILKPTSYSTDMTALLARAGDYERYPLTETVGQACTGGRLVCIAGASGEGKSTLAAALVQSKAISIDAYHFFKQADIRRQDRGLVIRSLSYQLAIRRPAFAQPLLDMNPSQVESLSDEAMAWKLLLETPLSAARGWRPAILMDALDESGGDGRMISLLVDLDNAVPSGEKEEERNGTNASRLSGGIHPEQFHNTRHLDDGHGVSSDVAEENEIGSNSKGNGGINIIVTTRSEPAQLSPLRSHWKGERYQEFSPSELRGEAAAQTDKESVAPLLRTLTELIRRVQPNLVAAAAASRDISMAYGLLFDRGVLAQHLSVLEVVLASYEPQSLSDLKAMGLLEMARRLPTHGELFLERENKLHLLHRSITEWLRDPEQGAVDAVKGHAQLAGHIWETTLRPWLFPHSSPVSISRAPSSGCYFLKYSLTHLREAGRFQDIQAILFRLPWLQAMLKEKGLGGLMKDLRSLASHSTLLAADTKKLLAVLSLHSSALFGSEAWKCLPAQLLGRLRETEEHILFQQLRQEANKFFNATGKWLKPLKSSLKAPGSLEMTMIGHKGPVSAIAVLPDGRIVSGSSDSSLRIWNSSTGDCERTLSGHEGEVMTIAILPDGRIVSGSDETVRIWNLSTGDCEMTLSGHEGEVRAVAVLPDGRIVSGSRDSTVRIWNSSTGDREKTLSGHKGRVYAIAVLPDGRIVSGSRDKTVRIWNSSTGDCEITLSGHRYKVNAIDFLPDGRIVSGSDDKTVRIWNSSTGDCDRILSGHKGFVNDIAVLPDGRIVSGSDDKTVRIWNSSTGDCEMTLSGHEGSVNAIAVLSDGRIVSASGDTTVRIWNSSTGDFEKASSGHKGCVYAVAVLPDGRIVSGSLDKTTRIWNLSAGDCEMTLSGHKGSVYAIAVLPDGRIVSGSDDDTLRIWNLSTGDCERILSGHKGSVYAIAVLPDGRIVSGSYDKTLRIWSLSTGDCESILYAKICPKEVRALLDGRLLSRDNNANELQLWSPIGGGGFQSERVSRDEYNRLKNNATSDGVVSDLIAPSYAESHNCVHSESFGRVFVDEAVKWVVKVNDVIAVFQVNGRDHWFREVEVK